MFLYVSSSLMAKLRNFCQSAKYIPRKMHLRHSLPAFQLFTPCVSIIRLQHFRNCSQRLRHSSFSMPAVVSQMHCKGTTRPLRFSNTLREIFHFSAIFFLFLILIGRLSVTLVTVLQFSKRYVHTLKILLYLYINIELIFNIPRLILEL